MCIVVMAEWLVTYTRHVYVVTGRVLHLLGVLVAIDLSNVAVCF